LAWFTALVVQGCQTTNSTQLKKDPESSQVRTQLAAEYIRQVIWMLRNVHLIKL
jgi:hypothetical protein